MDIYIAMCFDRHIDAVVRVYTTAEKAIAFAKGFAQRHAWYPKDIEESEIPGWLYHANFSVESDHVYVVKGTLDPPE